MLRALRAGATNARPFRSIALVAAFAALTLLSQGAAGHVAGTDTFQIIHPWAEPTDGTETKLFATVANAGETPVTIVGARSIAAARVEIRVADKAVDRVTIAPGDTIGPERLQFRIIGLFRPLEKGGTFPVVLILDDGDAIELRAVIGEDTTMPDMPATHGQH